MGYLREVLTPLTTLKEWMDTPLTPLKEGNDTPCQTSFNTSPLKEGNSPSGKGWQSKRTDGVVVEFEDETKISINDLDYK